MITDKDAAKDTIQVAVTDHTGLAKICGRGSFKISASLKEFGLSLIDRGIVELVIDLEDCIGMDSTFMGVTAGLCGRFHRESGGRVTMVHTSEKIQKLMTTLGLDRLVDDVDLQAAPEVPELKVLDIKPQTPLESAETMLEAHETLVEAHPQNHPRFQDVLDYLREDIRRQRQS